jgi:hypothetical protein
MFGFQERLECLFEWLTLQPDNLPLPQTSQMFAMVPPPLSVGNIN